MVQFICSPDHGIPNDPLPPPSDRVTAALTVIILVVLSEVLPSVGWSFASAKSMGDFPSLSLVLPPMMLSPSLCLTCDGSYNTVPFIFPPTLTPGNDGAIASAVSATWTGIVGPI